MLTRRCRTPHRLPCEASEFKRAVYPVGGTSRHRLLSPRGPSPAPMLSRPIVLGWMWGGGEARGGPRRDEYRAPRGIVCINRGWNAGSWTLGIKSTVRSEGAINHLSTWPVTPAASARPHRWSGRGALIRHTLRWFAASSCKVAAEDRSLHLPRSLVAHGP